MQTCYAERPRAKGADQLDPYRCGYWESLSSPADALPILEIVVAEMAAAGYSERDRFGMRLALEEALVNAIRHGNRGDSARRVWVRFQVGTDRVLAEVEDEGQGFDPNRVPDPRNAENWECPSGRGLLLMRQYTTWLRYNRRGNCVTLCKERSPWNGSEHRGVPRGNGAVPG
jgi:serine/threonine-protein kinase RsbW